MKMKSKEELKICIFFSTQFSTSYDVSQEENSLLLLYQIFNQPVSLVREKVQVEVQEGGIERQRIESEQKAIKEGVRSLAE